MSQDAHSPEGGSTPLSYGPQMYSFDGRPVDPPVSSAPASSAPSGRAADPLAAFRRSEPPARESIDREPIDGPPDPDAPALPQSMPPARWPLSVVGALFSLIFGAVALYFSYQVGARWQRGDAAGSAQASQMAMIWSVVAVAVGLLGFVIMSSTA